MPRTSWKGNDPWAADRDTVWTLEPDTVLVRPVYTLAERAREKESESEGGSTVYALAASERQDGER